MKNLLLTAAAALGFASATLAQVPNYVPTNGLVGWWPFNGNANDESGNGNNGTVNGVTLTSDRFGHADKAYSFDGIDDWIQVENQELFNFNNRFTINAWINTNSNSGTKKIVTKLQTCDDSYILQLIDGHVDFELAQGCGNWISYNNSQNIVLNNWHSLTATFDIDSALVRLYFDGVLILEQSRDFQISSSSANLVFGSFFNNDIYPDQFFSGLIDDIGIWNRALTQEEITNLYNGNICFETVTVTDTLLINMGIVGYNPITYSNTIKIFPNPSNDHITIDYGDFASLSGYQLRIDNSLGQQMFQTAINQQSSYISLSSWTGNGLYFVHIIDAQGNTIDIRKIVLQ